MAEGWHTWKTQDGYLIIWPFLAHESLLYATHVGTQKREGAWPGCSTVQEQNLVPLRGSDPWETQLPSDKRWASMISIYY